MKFSVDSNWKAVQQSLIARAAEWEGPPVVGSISNNVEYIGALNYGGVVEYDNPQNPSRKPGEYEFSSGRRSVFEEGKTTVFLPGAQMVAQARALSNKRFSIRIKQFKPITRAKTVSLINDTLNYALAVAALATPVNTGTARRGWSPNYAE